MTLFIHEHAVKIYKVLQNINIVFINMDGTIWVVIWNLVFYFWSLFLFSVII